MKLYGLDIKALTTVAEQVGLPGFAARQIADWLYKKGVETIGQMSNLALAARNRLVDLQWTVGRRAPLSVATSVDGTRKYLWVTERGNIESVHIPDGERATLCVSSQVGCRMGCAFCATGRMGLDGNLTAGEILNQFASDPEQADLTNIVYMGMGEPLDNLDAVLCSLDILTARWGYAWSPGRITLSTAGIIPALERFLTESNVHLAVSLHNAIPAERATLMPIELAYPIEEVVKTLRKYDFSHQRRLSFEYILLAGINDSPLHIKALTKLLNGLPCRINLIRFDKIPNSSWFTPPDAEVVKFRNSLTDRGLHTTIRASRGEDIAAACGLLATSQK